MAAPDDQQREQAYASEIGEQIKGFLTPIAQNDNYLKDHAFERTIAILKADNVSLTETMTLLGLPDELKYSASLPVILFMALGGVGVDTGYIKGHMDVHASTSDSLASKTELGADGEGKIGWGPISASVKIHASSSISTERKRDSDRSAGVEWQVNVKQLPAPEGVMKVLDTIQSFQSMGNEVNKTLAQAKVDAILEKAKANPAPSPKPAGK